MNNTPLSACTIKPLDVKKDKKMNLHIEYDSVLNCYTLHYKGEIVCLGANTKAEAKEEAMQLIENGKV